MPLTEVRSKPDVPFGGKYRIIDFEKKPNPMPSDPEQAYSSAGNCLFNRAVLVEVLERDVLHHGSHDFVRGIIPHMIGRYRVLAYNFLTNKVPGLQPHEEPGYWRDVGALDACWQAHMDILGEAPVAALPVGVQS